ncbi:MAG: hypothetical protein NC301_02490 [Bacteroides sp.]|nr:hypothetical protein [Bacteroides sp.]MCM1379600.1 hypothetical protein [Bacteroides sp.]MCM1446018.1 hypothetical protein [Prevotella sp.]
MKICYRPAVFVNLSDLAVNDIIIVGTDGKARGALFVSNILRGDGSTDCIQLNYKEVAATN